MIQIILKRYFTIIFTILSLVVCPKLLWADQAGEDITNQQDAFVHILISSKRVQPDFFYCLSDIKFFDDFNSRYCRYTIASFNIYLHDLNLGSIPFGRSEIILDVLTRLSNSYKKQ
jgi:hypothetical protein